MKTLLDGSHYARFIREGRAYTHEGIMPILEAYVPDDAPHADAYIVMPWCESSLLKVVRSRRLDGDVAGSIALMSKALDALEYLHTQGVAHRDIKPSNILLMQNGRAVLADFGLARGDEDIDLTGSEEKLGSLRYRAPEYTDHGRVTDFRPGDVFSVAKTLWALVAGREPDAGDVLRYQHHSLPTLLGTESELLKDFQYLLNLMTRAEPERRPTISEARTELSALVSPRPAGAETPPSLEGLLKRIEASAVVHSRQRDAAEGERLGSFVKELLQKVQAKVSPRISALGAKMSAFGGIGVSGLQPLRHDDPSARVLVDDMPELRKNAFLGFYGIFASLEPTRILPELHAVYVSFGSCVIEGRTGFACAAGSGRFGEIRDGNSHWRRVAEPVFIRDIESPRLARNLEALVEQQLASFEQLIAEQAGRVPA